MVKTLKTINSLLLKNQSTRQTIAKNTFWLSLSEITGKLLRVVVIVYAARILGAAGWGTFSYVSSLAAVLTIFSDIGISTVLIREVSKSPESREKYFSTTFVVKLFLTTLSLLVIIFIAPVFTKIDISKPLILFVALLFIFDSLRRFGTSLFRAEERMEREALVNIITQVIIVATGLAFLFLLSTPESLAAAYAIGAGIGLAIAALMLKADIKKLISGFNKNLLKPIIKDAWPLSLAAVFGALLVNIDTVMIGWFKQAESVGFYSAAQRPIAFLYILPTLIVGGFFPALARFAEKNKDDFREVLEKGLTFIFLLAFPIAIGIVLTAEQIITFVYGEQYLPAIGSLRILGITILTAFPMGIIIHGAFAYNQQKKLVPYWAGGTILNISLNFLLIPRIGISGAAWATLITQFIVNSLIWVKMKKINYFSILSRLKNIILATFMMGVAIVLLNQIDASLFIIIPVAMAIYFGSLVYSGVNPLQQLKSAIRHTT